MPSSSSFAYQFITWSKPKRPTWWLNICLVSGRLQVRSTAETFAIMGSDCSFIRHSIGNISDSDFFFYKYDIKWRHIVVVDILSVFNGYQIRRYVYLVRQSVWMIKTRLNWQHYVYLDYFLHISKISTPFIQGKLVHFLNEA